MRRAACACGQLSATCEGEPIRVSVCHCLNCKRRSGSAFSWTSRWPCDRVVVVGEAATFDLTGDEGGTATFSFCTGCGTTLHYHAHAQPDVVAIPAGCFADPAFPPPQYSVYDPSRRCEWVDIGIEDLERYA